MKGFTLVEVVVALVVLGAVMVVGVEGVRAGREARRHAAGHAALRALLEHRVAQVSARTGPDLEADSGVSTGRFPPPYDDATWTAAVHETGAGTGLFRVTVHVRRAGAVLGTTTYLNRFGELWTHRRIVGR